MVFYFTGTGNSGYVATTIANFLGLQKYFIPTTNVEQLEFEGERILFVFPVYSWGVPPLVLDFINRLPETFIESINGSGVNVDCVMTCGDETALSPEMISKSLQKRGVALNSVRSVIMPNNYVLLPGFNVDPKKLEQNKLEACKGRILEIAEALQRGDKGIDVTRGNLAWIKSKLIYPLFKRWGIFPKNWHFEPTCISCGKCAAICPVGNIKMKTGHPEWGPDCCSCLGCYHICPVHAVEYGKSTKKKGQYIFPLFSLKRT